MTDDDMRFEPLRADVIECAQRAHGDADTQLFAFFEELRRVDLIYGAYGRRSGLPLSVYLIFDYICENDGTSQREICAYTLLPRQSVNNVVNSLAAGPAAARGQRARPTRQAHPAHRRGEALARTADRAAARRRAARDGRARTRRAPRDDRLRRQVHERARTSDRRPRGLIGRRRPLSARFLPDAVRCGADRGHVKMLQG